jgi:intein/homing endonuclease
MKKTDAAYIAGFFDGEGCIIIRGGENRSRQVRITIGQKYKNILVEFKDILGYGTLTGHSIIRWTGSGYKFQFRISNIKDITHFIKLILPYARCKKTELELALKFLQTKHSLSVKEREKIRLRMQRLKRIPH